ncbi:MAG: hypothetical protein LBU92_02800 [Prevotellaceae bacterium]|jgi:hypothetical protein|nr:hypothetical protein [Prevotellaceae bacterium]
MKKAIILIAAVFFGAAVATAQEQTFTKGTNIGGIGIGFGGNLYSGLSGSGVSKIPAITAFYERGVKDQLFDEKSSLGIGGVLGYKHAKYEENLGWLGNFGWKSTSIIIGARGTLHYALIDKFDTYTSLTLGYNIVSWKWLDDSTGGLSSTAAAASGFTWTWNIGARYFVTEQIAAFAELGYGFSVLNLGAVYKF